MNNSQKKPVAAFSAGLLFSRSLRRVVHAAGYAIRNGWIGSQRQAVAVWGRIPMSKRVLARWNTSKIVTFEDAFLRSVLPGFGSPPIGLNIDDIGVHFDGSKPSKLENILNSKLVDDPVLLKRAENGRAFLQHYGLSKYNPVPRGYGNCPEPGFVLVIDQVVGDASIAGGQADAGTFAEMLAVARRENPNSRIIIRTHPAVLSDGRTGHFLAKDIDDNTVLSTETLNPWDILEAASKVYCVSSQMGFEAILAGHRPEVFGLPFYAGWGLSEDRLSTTRRERDLGVDQLFVGAMLVYPFWYNHARRTACDFEQAAQQLLAEARHRWDGLKPTLAIGMRLWKRKNVARFLSGANEAVRFTDDESQAVSKVKVVDGQVVVWAGKETNKLRNECKLNGIPLKRMEDGFLRSSGLGAALTPASSLVLDDCGIYYDPTKHSQMERLISQSINLPDFAIERAEKLRKKIAETRVSKYNLEGEEQFELPKDRKIILVPGQVEDDASIKLGATEVKSNLDLLKVTRAENPDAYIVYKPHPDVVAGLRVGAIEENLAAKYADAIIENADAITLIEACDEVWTITSLTGFEALIRNKRVTCLGTPFYAGWGLTRDLALACVRRGISVSLDQLVHATLIDYPRYMDPVSNLACTPELIVDRLALGAVKKTLTLKALSKLQGLFASWAFIWR